MDIPFTCCFSDQRLWPQFCFGTFVCRAHSVRTLSGILTSVTTGLVQLIRYSVASISISISIYRYIQYSISFNIVYLSIYLSIDIDPDIWQYSISCIASSTKIPSSVFSTDETPRKLSIVIGNHTLYIQTIT
jgi:hypothetical protein